MALLIGVLSGGRDVLQPLSVVRGDTRSLQPAVFQRVGFFAPAKTPAATVQALSREIARIVNMPEVKERLVTSGYEVVASTPEQFAERVRLDTEKYRKIILESGMQQL